MEEGEDACHAIPHPRLNHAKGFAECIVLARVAWVCAVHSLAHWTTGCLEIGACSSITSCVCTSQYVAYAADSRSRTRRSLLAQTRWMLEM